MSPFELRTDGCAFTALSTLRRADVVFPIGATPDPA